MRQAVIQKAEEKQRRQQPNLTGIPTQMKLDFEQRSGLSFDDVRVHYNSDKPRKIGALAYTQGTQVHIGPGQERHLRHELGHVVQQKQGIVQPSGKLRGRQVNTNPQLEQQADSILDTTYPLNHLNLHNSHVAQEIFQFEFNNNFSPYIYLIGNIFDVFFKNYQEGLNQYLGSKVPIPLYDFLLGDDYGEYMKHLFILEANLRSHLPYGPESLQLTPSRDLVAFLSATNRVVSSVAKESPFVVRLHDPICKILRLNLQDAQKSCDSLPHGRYANTEQMITQELVDFYPTPLQKKAYLRRINGKRDEKYMTKKNPSAVAPLFVWHWSGALNDVYIGNITDNNLYFRIDDISDEQKRKIEEINRNSTTAQNKAEQLLEYAKSNYGTIDGSKLYSENVLNRYPVLVREIIQLFYKGYIFKCYDRRDETRGKQGLGLIKLLAFKDNTALTAYQEEYNRKHTPRTASEGDSSTTSSKLPEVKPVTT